MKKTLILAFLFLTTIGFVGCSNNQTTTSSSNIKTTDLMTTEDLTTMAPTTSLPSTTTEEALGEVFVDVEMGYIHSIALSSEGRVFTWGDNAYGQLGYATGDYHNSLINITNNFQLIEGEMIVDVDCGHFHSMALTSNGRLLLWGDNHYSQIPGLLEDQTSYPLDVTSHLLLEEGETIINIDAGAGHSGVLTSFNRLIMWGHNGFGEIGAFSEETLLSPVDITEFFYLDDGEVIDSFTIGYQHSAVETSSGRIFAWGSNGTAQIGDYSYRDRNKPKEITSFIELEETDDIMQIQLGYWFSSVLTINGDVFMWGSNRHGELGINDEYLESQRYPINMTEYFNLTNDDQIVALYHGGFHSFAITNHGDIYAWGESSNGRLAINLTESAYIPLLVTDRFELDDGETITLFNLGNWTSSMLTSKGRLFVWGPNEDGRLGLGTTINYAYPVEIPMP